VQRMLSPTVVGRAGELAWVSAALDDLGTGRGGSLFVIGESGIGKSRLADEAAAQGKRRGVWVLSGRATPTGRAAPYQALTTALLHGLRSRAVTDISRVPGLRAGLATLIPGFIEGPAIDPSPVLLAETIVRLARTVAGEEGTLIVLEDLHWACGDTLSVTEYLADIARLERVLVLATTRPQGPALALSDALERRGAATTRVLAPLGAAEVSAMAATCLGDEHAAVPAAVSAVLGAHAEGLPFLVEELLAALVNRGTLVASNAGWELVGDADSVDVPLSFAQTVRERVGQLAPDERRVLEYAALLGRDFDWPDLPVVAGVDEGEVLEALRRAVGLQLVEEAGGGRFRFRHALTVEAILAGMLDPQRTRLAAHALGELAPDPEHVAPERLGLAAHLATQAARPIDAAQYLTQAARSALAAGAVATARGTARSAAALVPPAHPAAITADEVLLAALSAAGDIRAVEQLGTQLLARLDALGPCPERQAAVRLRLARAVHAALDLRRARRLCEEALQPADGRLRIELDLMLAEIAFTEHDHAASVAIAETALGDADAAGLPDLACDALELIGRHRMFVTLDVLGAQPILLESLRRAEAADLPLTRLRLLQRLAFHDLARGAGRSRMHEGRAVAVELGVPVSVAEFDHLLATQHLIAGEHDEAQLCVDRGLAEARRYGLTELTVLLQSLRATISAVRGRRSDAEEEAAAAASAAGDVPLMRAAVCGTPLVVAALADDDLASAARRVSETRARLPDALVFWPPFLGSFYGAAAVVMAASGARELTEGRDWAAVDDVYQRGSFWIARAIIAGRAGDAERAAELFREGDERLTAVPWVRALYRRYAAEAALADGWGDPTTWLGQAESIFDTCGNVPLARACRSLLRLAGTSPRRRRETSGASDLTTRESEVLALLAQGLANKDIAQRLYLSPRTVEKHVERILAKMGQPNRTALAASVTAEVT
jgi:DNA-binding CsgD family transcriptional regulator